ncbi:MAG TPA: head GIN domain-containing protein, partial [Bacteroidales bacterium]
METNRIKISLILTIITCLIGFTTIQAQQVTGNGNVQSQERNVGSFTGIKNSCSADIFISKGESGTIKVVADENLLEYITTTVQNGILVIDTKGSFWNSKKMEVYLTMNNLTSMELNGSGNVNCSDVLTGSNVNIRMGGSGDLNANLEVKNLDLSISGSGNSKFSGVRGNLKISISGSGDVEASNLQLDNCSTSTNGSGDMKLSGSVVDLSIKISGSGDINAYNLKAVNASITCNGSGDVVTNVVEKLQVSLNGSGDVTYTGSPGMVDVDV